MNKSKLLFFAGVFALASTSFGTHFFITRGLQGADSFDKNSSNANNWASHTDKNVLANTPFTIVSSTGYSLTAASATPKQEDYVYLTPFSGYSGETFEDGVTNVINFDATSGVEAKIGQINQWTPSGFSTMDASKAVKYIRTNNNAVLVFDMKAGDSVMLLKDNNHATELHVQANVTVVSGEKIIGIRNRTQKDLVLGQYDKNYTFRVNGAAFSHIDSYMDLKLRSSGNIVFYSQLLGNTGTSVQGGAIDQYKGFDIKIEDEATTPTATGSVIFAGTKVNEIELLDITDSTTVKLQMREGVTFNAGNDYSYMTVGSNKIYYKTDNRIRLSQNSKLSVEGANQIEASTDLIFRVADATTSAGTVLLNNNDITIENINYEFEGNTSNKLTAVIDFGAEKGIANNVEISGSILTSILTDASGNKIESIDFANTELIIKNFDKEAGDLIYVFGGSIDDNILSTISFDGLGEKGIDYEVVYDGMNLGYNLIPEPSSYALFFGVLALGYVISRRK